MYKLSKVSIVVPAKDEGQGLEKILKSLKSYTNDLILVDGHSKDNTKSIAKKLKVKYILDNGLGRGDAVRLGIEAAKNNIVLFFDADGSHNAHDIPLFITPIANNKADLVIGSRRTGGSFDLNMSASGILRSGGSDFLAYLVNKRFGTNLSDILYSFRAVRKSIVTKLDLSANGFEIEQEMVVKCLKKGYKLLEIPSRENARAWGKAKLRTITGVKFILHLIKELYF